MRAKGQGGRCSASSLLTEGVFSWSFGSKLDLLFFYLILKERKLLDTGDGSAVAQQSRAVVDGCSVLSHIRT